MKKICFFFLVLLLFPTISHANSRYDIESWDIRVQILENGDLEVQEFMILNGSYSVFSKDLFYRDSNLPKENPVSLQKDQIYNGSGIQNIVVKAKILDKNKKTDPNTLEPLKRAYYQEDALNKEYVESSMQDGKNLSVYFESNYDRVMYSFSYTISNVIVLHKDVAEFFWEFVREDFKDFIDLLTITILLPEADSSSFFHSFFHGDINATQTCYDHQRIVTTYKKLPSNNAISVRVTFDRNMIKESLYSKKNPEVVLDQILKLEERSAKEYQRNYEKNEKITYGMEKICIFYLVFLLLFVILVYFKYVREYRLSSSSFDPLTYSAAIIDTFFHGTVSESGFIAMFLDLLSKNRIDVKETKKGIFFTQSSSSVSKISEEFFLEFFFEKIGKDNQVSLEAICSYISGEKSSKIFRYVYESWTRLVQKEVERENFFESNGLPVIASIFLFLIAFFIFSATIFFEVPLFLSTVVLFASTLFFFYTTLIKKRTRKGSEVYSSWKVLQKRMEKEEGTFSKKEKESYFPFAIVFHMPLFGGEDVKLQRMIYQKMEQAIQKSKK